MSVVCPYCQHKMRVKGAHPGRFLPVCDRCSDRFILIIPAEPDAPMIITPLEQSRRKLQTRKSHSHR